MSTQVDSHHVEAGKDAVAWTVALSDDVEVEVRKLSVGEMDNNVYVLTETGSGQALLVDAAADADRILAEVGDRPLAGIVTTHGHWDHWRALGEVARATGAPTYLHPEDAQFVNLAADVEARDGLKVTFGAAEVELVHTPGHTPGSTCVRLGDRQVFSGDTLFPGGPGNTSFDHADFATIMRSLRERLFTLDDATQVSPGHGDDTTIGAERPRLDEWESRGW